jgi:3-hydroxyisobutyrate dehydrogenase
MLKIGFIGLGNMGLPMSIKLAEANYTVVATDIDKNIANKINGTNIIFEQDLSNLVKNKDIIITMLPNGKIVKEVWNSFINFISKETLLVDCSTIDIDTTKLINLLASENGLSTLDAPVSGGVIGAQNGTLTFMVGGDKKNFNYARPLFEVMGNKSILCGTNGSGQLAKTCNNLILATSMIGVSEAFNLAKNSSLDLQVLFEVLSTSTASCWAINNYCPVPKIGPSSPADNNYEGGFAASLMSKDLGIALQALNSSKTPSPLGKHVDNIYKKMVNSGLGHLDFSAIIKHINKQ